MMWLTCLIFTFAVGTVTWWLIDLIYFGLNERDSGDGCSLIKDL